MSTAQRLRTVTTDNSRTLVSGLIVVGGLYLTYRVGRSLIAELRKSEAQAQMSHSPEVQQAMTLRGAMNPSGIALLMPLDTTNVRQIMDTAVAIRKFEAVAKAYRDLYRSNLADDLQSELSAQDYQRFMTLVSSTTNPATGTPSVYFASPGALIVARQPVFIRSSPDATYNGAVYEVFSGSKNILRTAQAGEFLGFATGNQQYDSKNNVKFIQVGFTVGATGAPLAYLSRTGQRITYWVSSSASYVDQFASLPAMAARYPGRAVTEAGWMRPLSMYTATTATPPGVGGLVATDHILVMDEGFKPVGIAAPRMLLGTLDMEMRQGSDNFYRFRTIGQDKRRWVDGRNVKILNP